MKLFPLALLATVGALSGVASAAPTVWSANDHAYEVITNPNTQGTYAAAKAAAASMTFRGVQGRLVVLDTATYTSELTFVGDLVRASAVGGSNYWMGAERPALAGSVTAGWNWVDGTTIPTSITSMWAIDQFEGPAATNAYGAAFYFGSNPTFGQPYDYIQSASGNFPGGYVVEYAAPVPEPATLAALGLGAAALLRRRRKA